MLLQLRFGAKVNTRSVSDFDHINRRVVQCTRCPRLRAWCRQVAQDKRKSFSNDDYWGKPVPNFGDPQATGLIVGLAPAAHGANRTGRMFTGDRSGDWLYRALHKAGLASQSASTSADDGLKLQGVIVTAVAHCAPPDNKPTREEIAHCRVHLQATIELRDWKAFLCLGATAWTELHRTLDVRASPKFSHGVEHVLPNGRVILASYHPSQQNTFTGKLTERMFDDVVSRFARLLD